jgi:hypothetical protein
LDTRTAQAGESNWDSIDTDTSKKTFDNPAFPKAGFFVFQTKTTHENTHSTYPGIQSIQLRMTVD